MGEKRRGITADLSGWLVYAAVTLFVLVVGSIFLSLLLNSFAT